MDLKHTTTVMDAVSAIPSERLWQKVRRTGLGLAFFGGAVYMAGWLKTPWYTYLPVAVFGGWLISADLTQQGVNFVVAIVKDLLAAVRGKGA